MRLLVVLLDWILARLGLVRKAKYEQMVEEVQSGTYFDQEETALLYTWILSKYGQNGEASLEDACRDWFAEIERINQMFQILSSSTAVEEE